MQIQNDSRNYFAHPLMHRDGYRIIRESDIVVGQRVFLVDEPNDSKIDRIASASIIALRYSGVWKWRKLSGVVLEFEELGTHELSIVDVIHPRTTPLGSPRQAYYVKQ